MDLASARIVLDPAAVVPVLAAIPALRAQPPQDAAFTALWVKPGRHCHAAYAVRCEGAEAPRTASVCAIDGIRAATLAKALGPHRTTGMFCPHCAIAVTAPGVLAQLFPVDYRLPTLPVCFELDRLQRTVPSECDVQEAQVAGYRPGMRCQIRYVTTGGTLYGKVAFERERGSAFARHLQIAQACDRTAGRVRVATPFSYLPDLHLTMVWAAAGESLYDALHAGDDLTPVMPLVAAALSEFHRLQVDAIRRVYSVSDEMALVVEWVGLVARWFPTLAPALRQALGDLCQNRPADLAPGAFVHRDFYDKQVLVAGDGVVMLDLDTACRGDAEIDVGNFCAQLVLRGLQLSRIDACAAYAEAFVGSFPARLAMDRVRWYRRAALLRLACGYALRPRWHQLAPALIDEAQRP